MGGKPSNFNMMNAMATDRKDRVNDETVRTDSKHDFVQSEQTDNNLIPNTPENPVQAEMRAAMKSDQERREEREAAE